MSKFIKNTVMAMAALSVVAGTLAMPNMASAYPSRTCKYEEKHSSKTGTVVGAVAGGVAGGSLANTHNKGLGTVLGAVAGGLIGSKVGKDHGKETCERQEVYHHSYHHRARHH